MLLQIANEFGRFSKSMAEKPRIATFYGGVQEEEDRKILKSTSLSPHIVVGTPGRIKSVSSRTLVLCHCTAEPVKSQIADNMLVSVAAGAEEGSQAGVC